VVRWPQRRCPPRTSVPDPPGSGDNNVVRQERTPQEALIVLDNCEHLLYGIVVLVERLLAACPRVIVLATSRARLLVPYEHVFLVHGMTVFGDDGDDGDDGDAMEPFLGRAAATGGPAGPSIVIGWPRSAAGWTVWRWPSSWPPPGCPRWA
jgi:hypothetical protein